MKYAELTKKLRKLGCYRTRYGAGSHEIWRNPATQKQTPIPYHHTKDMALACCHAYYDSWVLIARTLTRPEH